MSMNDNLEVKVNELTNVIRGLSDKPSMDRVEVKELIDSLVQKVEEANLENFTNLSDEVSDSLIKVLEDKNSEIKERLGLFEDFISSVEKNIQNPKVETEITRILNDIEALHSKMNSQELQTEGLIKSFESLKNASSTGQISKLCDDIVSISKSYDGIVEVLNNNFQEFLRRVEALSSREEFQRLRYFLESIEGNQNVLVSAMNAVSDKQEEIKNIIRQSSSVQNTEKFEQLQSTLNQINRLIVDSATKGDLEVLADKISSLNELVNEFKRSVDDLNDNDLKNVFQGQLNNIISKLEGLKMDSNSNVNEDIIRLYTSIAEFKDGVNSALNTQINDVIASMDVQFDKISNSLVNSVIESSDAINSMKDEIQKLNTSSYDVINKKAEEIKTEIKTVSQNNLITAVNSIKGELSNIMSGLSSLANNEGIVQLSNSIESLKSGIDIDSLIIQMDNIKQNLDLGPIKEQLVLLNKDEAINSIIQKIDYLSDVIKNINHTKQDENASKSSFEDTLNLLYENLNLSNQKVKDSILESKEEAIEHTKDLNSNLLTLAEKINEGFSNINECLDGAVKNFREDLELNSNKSKDSILSVQNNFENSLSILSEKFNIIESHLNSGQSEKIEEIKEGVELIGELVKTINFQALFDEFSLFEKNILEISEEEKKDLKEAMLDFQSLIKGDISSIKEFFVNLKKEDDNEVFMQIFNEFELRMNEKLQGIETLIEQTENEKEAENNYSELNSNIQNLKSDIISSYSELIEDFKNPLLDAINDVITRNNAELNAGLEDLIKNEFELLSQIVNDKSEQINKEIPSKIVQILASRDNSQARVELIKQITSALSAIQNNTNSIQKSIEMNSNNFNETNSMLKENALKMQDIIKEGSINVESTLCTLVEGINLLDNKIAEMTSKNDQGLFDSLNDVSRTIEDLKFEIENLSLGSSTNHKETGIIIKGIDDKLNELKETLLQAFREQAEKENNNLKEDLNRQNEIKEIKESVSSGYKETENRIVGLEGKINELKNSLIQGFNEQSEQKSQTLTNEIENKLNELKDSLTQNLNLQAEKESGSLINGIQDKLNELKETLMQGFSEQTEKESGNVINGINDKFNELKDSLIQAISSLNLQDEQKNNLKEEINRFKDELVQNLSDGSDKRAQDIKSSLNETVFEINKNVDNTKEKAEEIKNEIKDELIKATETFKEGIEEVKSSIIAEIIRTQNEENHSENFVVEIDEKLNEKVSQIEGLIENSSNKSNERILDIVNSNNENYKNTIDEKIDYAINSLKTDFESKMTDIQKIVDSKLYEIVNRNNEIIKDELKLRADANLKEITKEFSNKISKIESVFVKDEQGDDTEEKQSYTLLDVESDIAKIRLGLEKNNKLSNFKEFASRLVELKNINLENAKITRVIGSDIMRFDSWLKNTTARIDLLAAKIEKSEKIKMEDLKSRLIQSEKNQSMPQKLEEAVLSIYKKYRLQENKIEELINKVDTISLSNKNADNFDVKEFIDIFYDNTQKTQNLISRMDGIEDKMDLIQAKIDHIISSCIDEAE